MMVVDNPLMGTYFLGKHGIGGMDPLDYHDSNWFKLIRPWSLTARPWRMMVISYKLSYKSTFPLGPGNFSGASC